jgi:uncharacterized protein (TIGR00251 family)
MKDRSFHLHDGKTGSAITVRVTPRSSRNEVSEILDDGTIKVRLTASSPDEKMNQALVNFLAQVLQVLPGQLEIVAGKSGNDKLITITDLDSNAVQERILASLE